MRSIVPEIRVGHIELRDVSFRYPNASRDSLSDLDVKIEPGERIGIIGRVASGKSTLGRVLCGLYPADRRRDARRWARQPPVPPAPAARGVPLRQPGCRRVQRHGSRQSDARSRAGRRPAADRRRGPFRRRHLPVARRGRVRPPRRRARNPSVGRAALPARAGPGAGEPLQDVVPRRADRARWIPRPSSISSSI